MRTHHGGSRWTTDGTREERDRSGIERVEDVFLVRIRKLFVVVAGGGTEAGGDYDWGWRRDGGGDWQCCGKAKIRPRFRYLFPF